MTGQVYRLEPKSGSVKNMVVLLHGYGANGQDLIGLGLQWQNILPDTVFVSPDAPEVCQMNPFGGFQWFDLTLRDPTEYWRGVQKAGPGLNSFLDVELGHYGLSDENLALVGFSQGTMMALHVGLRRTKALSAIVGFSGKLAGPEHLKAGLTHKAPVLLVHGAMDDVIPVAALDEARGALQALGVDVSSHVSPSLGHGIDPDGLNLGGAFLVKHLL